MGNGCIELYHIMGVHMDKEKYLSEPEAGLCDQGRSVRYIAACMKYANTLLNAGLPVIFDTTHLALLIGIETRAFGKLFASIDEGCYRELRIPKKNGGERTLDIPSVDLKVIQRWILDNILSKMHVSQCAHGFVTGKSIVTNAVIHTGKECIINMDIEDFFPSVSFERVFRVFKYYGYTKELSYVMARLCTYKGYLPQGSPASPAITNILCLKLDKRLNQLAQTYHCSYSRYADDLTFSGNKGIGSMISIVDQIISDEGFRINKGKTRIAYKHQRQEVTGLIVNENELRVSKDYKRRLRQEIYYCKKYGVDDHQKRKGPVFSYFKEHLYGKAYFVKMVEPFLGEKFLSELDEITWEY